MAIYFYFVTWYNLHVSSMQPKIDFEWPVETRVASYPKGYGA